MGGETETVLFSKDGTVAHIVLNRPGVVNAYNTQMRDELFQALEAVRDDPDVRVAVLRGVGERGFCAGADLTEFGTAPSQVIARGTRWERDIWGLFLGIRKPLVAALHGQVLGSGVEIACLCDIRVASQDAVFSMPEVALGMLPAAGGTLTLPRIVGMGDALEMLLTSRHVSAQEALRVGLVHKVVPNDALLEEAEQIAESLASRSPVLMSGVKTAVLTGMDMPLERGLELEERLVAQVLIGHGQ
jgi:enoyl-CoA hydratase/carnithine racemase